MPTVGEALNKVSELRSRYAILHALVTHLETHYKSQDAGAPELRVTRDDYAIVPEEHIDKEMAIICAEMDQIQAEIEEWSHLAISVPEDEDSAESAEDGDNGSPKKPQLKKRKKNRATASEGDDRPASGESKSGGDG